MNRFFIAVSVALIASAHGYSAGNSYNSIGAETGSGHFQIQGAGQNIDSSNSASAAAAANAADNAGGFAGAAPSTFGSNQNIPYQTVNTRGNSISSSISYPNNKGEILIHRPAAIIVKRPPTKVVVNHPPLVVKPAPVVLHKPPAVVVRKVFIKHHPRPVKVEPVYVNVVKPPAEKYFVNEKQQQFAGAQSFGPINVNPASFGPAAGGASVSSDGSGLVSGDGSRIIAGGGSGLISGSGSELISNSGSGISPGAFSSSGVDSAATSAGYQLLHSKHGVDALANLSGYGYPGASPSSYNGPPY